MLHEVINKLGISHEESKDRMLSWREIQDRKVIATKLPSAIKKLQSLDSCVSYNMRKKMAMADITSDLILDAYRAQGLKGLVGLLGKDENGKVRVTKDSEVIRKLFQYLQEKYK
ncbi:hypothetical protein QAD02_005885 [Eretmocerus hayati]|uniref:Uncharacterized protein n=1 Tax=Eretmocerus hayati TaxID=131215 RepID=A0ACC2MZK6_9HYME|nr:hypothetical protein QAD02_005885 [Eretmocerus hayati]